jgi:DNA-binding CsgD family transcriptional regulator
MTAVGSTYNEIARECFVTYSTVETTLENARARLSAKTTAHCVVLAIALELLILTHDGRVVVPHPHRITA